MRIKLILLVLLTGQVLMAQTLLLDSAALFKTKEYTNLDSALAHKEDVVRLNLRKQKLKEFPIAILEIGRAHV